VSPWSSISLAAAFDRVARQEGGPAVGKTLLLYKIQKGDIATWARNVFRPVVLWQHADDVIIDECPVCRNRHRLHVEIAIHTGDWDHSTDSLLSPDDWQADVTWTEESLSRRTYSFHPSWVDAYGIRLHLAEFEEAFPPLIKSSEPIGDVAAAAPETPPAVRKSRRGRKPGQSPAQPAMCIMAKEILSQPSASETAWAKKGNRAHDREGF
jgi:hypothetical protein